MQAAVGSSTTESGTLVKCSQAGDVFRGPLALAFLFLLGFGGIAAGSTTGSLSVATGGWLVARAAGSMAENETYYYIIN